MTTKQARELVRVALSCEIITRQEAGQYQKAISRNRSGWHSNDRLRSLMSELAEKLNGQDA